MSLGRFRKQRSRRLEYLTSRPKGGSPGTNAPITNLVWQPGGTASPGVFPSWSDLCAATLLFPGLVDVFFDDSFDACEIPGGSWTIGPNVSFVGAYREDGAQGTIVTTENNTVRIAPCPIAITNIDFRPTGPTGTHGIFNIDTNEACELRNFIFNGDGSASGICFYVQATDGNLFLFVDGVSMITTGATFVKVQTTETDAGTLFLYTADDAEVQADVIDWDVASDPTLNLQQVGISSVISGSQIGGTIYPYPAFTHGPIFGDGIIVGGTGTSPYAAHGDTTVVPSDGDIVLSPDQYAIFDISIDTTAWTAQHQVLFPSAPAAPGAGPYPNAAGGYTKILRNIGGTQNMVVRTSGFGGQTVIVQPGRVALIAFTQDSATLIAGSSNSSDFRTADQALSSGVDTELSPVAIVTVSDNGTVEASARVCLQNNTGGAGTCILTLSLQGFGTIDSTIETVGASGDIRNVTLRGELSGVPAGTYNVIVVAHPSVAMQTFSNGSTLISANIVASAT